MTVQESYEAPIANPEIQELSYPLYESRTWIKVWAYLSIVGGALQAITLVGIIFAWLPIWMGILLLKVVKAVETAQATGDKFAFLESQTALKTFFTIMGIITVIGIIAALIPLCIVIIALITGGGNFLDEGISSALRFLSLLG
jgi:uncharacterized membrane protein